MSELDKKSEKDEIEQLIADEELRPGEREQTITCKEYLKLLKEDPQIAQNASARLLEMILSYGEESIPASEMIPDATKRYRLFADNLFGVDKPIQDLVEFLKIGAQGLSSGKQILLLVGPPASGKSTLVTILKKALEEYRTRPVFAIKGCPIREEPLHLVPKHLREKFGKKLGVKIEGDLCPPCRHNLLTNYKDKENGIVRWWDVKVEPFTFSIQATRGIGSFEPSDEKTSDVSQLVGRENIAISSTKGPDHPEAYSLNGEIEKANRGLFEAREFLKAREELLWVFISVGEEKEIKVQGSSFPHISIDVVCVGHCNLVEFKKFAAKKENEALHNRIYTIFFPYPLRIKDEVRIYKKLIEKESNFVALQKCHIAPGALELAALFAVLTRLIESGSDISLLLKAKIYNGDTALTALSEREKHPIDLRQLREEGQKADDVSKREGMFGMSSRDILAALNKALIKYGAEGGCLTPLKVIKALREVFNYRMGYTPEDIKRYSELLSSGEKGAVMSEYKEFIMNAVTRAFLNTYGDLVQGTFSKYIHNVELYRAQRRRFVKIQSGSKDDLTDKPQQPDVDFMRSIEKYMDLSESQSEGFRGEVLETKNKLGEEFNYKSYLPLTRAIEKKLFDDCRHIFFIVLNDTAAKNDEEKKRADDLFSGLLRAGFCDMCAREALEKAREFMKK